MAQRARRQTRRTVLGGGLAAAAWAVCGSAGADAPAPADGFVSFEAAPAQLQLGPPPAEAAVTYAYRGAIPGPLVKVRQGEEVKLRFANRLAEPTTLSFPGLRAANAGAGVGGLTQERLKAGESADIRFVAPDAGFNLYLPHAGLSDAAQQGRGLFGPIIIEEAVKPDVDLDVVILLSDWNIEADGQIKDDFSDPAVGRGSGRRGRLVFANGAAAPLKLTTRPGARVRLRLGSAATARLATVAIDGAKALIVAVDGQPSEPFEPLNNQFPMGPGARFELMFDMPRDLSAGVRLDLRGGAGEADRQFVAIATEGEQVAARSGPRRLPANPLLPAEIALESARRCDFAISGGGSSPFAVNGATSSTGRRSPLTRFRAARQRCSRSPTRRRLYRRCGFGAMSRGSCIRWTTGGNPTGAIPSSSSPAELRILPSSPTIPANGRSNRRFPNIAPRVSGHGFR